jgi:hypothetical protein
MAKQRECPLCGKLKPLTTGCFPFQKDKSHPNGYFRKECIVCFNDKRRARFAAPDTREEKLEAVVEHRLKQRVAQLEAEGKALLADLDSVRRSSDLEREAAQHKITPIRPRERSGGTLREATALACASDWHIEEEVRPEQVAGRNRYNLAIAEKRMTRFFEAVRYAITFNRQIFAIRDLLLWLGGDIITNYLREENVESNQLAPPKAIAFACANLVAGIRYLLEDGHLEKIRIPCIDGNHGRLNGKEKIKHATRAANSLEWLLYTMLAREFADDDRVEFEIAEGEIQYLDVYGRTVRFLHGDIVHYAGGVGGVTIPLMKAISRWDTTQRADLTVLGHFHQYTSTQDVIINGSLIGHSPYSVTIGARFEPPLQAFTMLDPLRFKSVAMPLWVSERSDDQKGFYK